MKSKREVLKSFAEKGVCPEDLYCFECPYQRRCYKLKRTLNKIGAREILKRFSEKEI